MTDVSMVSQAEVINPGIEATRLFLQTMLVVDNEASYRESLAPAAQPAKTPTPRRMKATSPDVPVIPPTQPNGKGLDVKALVDNALKEGIICSVMKPASDDDLLSTIKQAAEVADILCLDWEMDDNGERACELIKTILQYDSDQDGALRYIAIYTGQKTVANVCNKVFDIFHEMPIALIKKEVLIEGSNIRISFFVKKSHVTGVPDHLQCLLVDEKDLPKTLINDFSNFANGIMPNVALASIASIRKSTHHLLAKFNADMDGPLFTHRAQIPVQEEADRYPSDLVSAEIRSILSKSLIDSQFSSISAIRKRIETHPLNTENKLIFKYKTKKSEVKQCELPIESIYKFLESGIDGHFQKEKDERNIQIDIGKSDFKKQFTNIFTTDFDKSDKVNIAFLKLTSTRCDLKAHDYADPIKVPSLSLGTVIKCIDNKVLLCIQPSCDSVRIKSATNFIFLPMKKATDPDVKSPQFVIHDLETSEDIKLEADCQAFQIKAIEFSPAEGPSEVVKANFDATAKNYFFQATDKTKYDWIGELKREYAQKIAQIVANNLARLGLNEFEPERHES